MRDKYRILSIDGGGTRGIIPATILNCIYNDTGNHPLEYFDLMAGTSTGGIICLALAAQKSTARLVKLYKEEASEIFSDSHLDDIRDGFGKNIGADYSSTNLKRILEQEFGDTTLGQVHESQLQTYREEKIIMISSFDLNPTENNRPVNFKPIVFNSSFKRDTKELLVDLAMRTSAGPTYFPVYQSKYIDGGVALNHPAMAAVAFALNNQNDLEQLHRFPDGVKKGLGKNPAELKVLSLGCGTSNRNCIPPTTITDGDWGNLQWVKYLPDMLTESNVQASDYYVRQVLDPQDYMRIQLEFDSPLAPIALRGRVLGLDVKDKILLEAMHQYAIDYYERNKQAILAFLELPQPKPVNV